jgi:hypothetical protein
MNSSTRPCIWLSWLASPTNEVTTYTKHWRSRLGLKLLFDLGTDAQALDNSWLSTSQYSTTPTRFLPTMCTNVCIVKNSWSRFPSWFLVLGEVQGLRDSILPARSKFASNRRHDCRPKYCMFCAFKFRFNICLLRYEDAFTCLNDLDPENELRHVYLP